MQIIFFTLNRDTVYNPFLARMHIIALLCGEVNFNSCLIFPLKFNKRFRIYFECICINWYAKTCYFSWDLR